jgi:AcrR family transcriptional regulator
MSNVSANMVFSQMPETRRKYELKKRAERQAETRRRIVQATEELHRTVGPAKTTISEIAERAGVQRLTVYNHFPDERDLFAACSALFQERNPPPDPSAWSATGDPEDRLRTALTELYAYYEQTEDMTGNVLRDAETMPGMRELVEQGWGPFMEYATGLLAEGRPRRKAVRAAIALALQFSTWRSLVRGSGLSRPQAVDLMVRAAREAA